MWSNWILLLCECSLHNVMLCHNVLIHIRTYMSTAPHKNTWDTKHRWPDFWYYLHSSVLSALQHWSYWNYCCLPLCICRFKPFKQHLNTDRSGIREWQARESVIETLRAQTPTPPQGTAQGKVPLLPTNPPTDKHFVFNLPIKWGHSTSLIEFGTYYYVGGVPQPKRYDPVPPAHQQEQGGAKGTGEVKEKNTNLQQ